jgi:parallel beta-helix repeat protein
MHKLAIGTLALAAAFAAAAPASARQVNVATSAQLISAINAAKAGDEIILADGTYSLSGSHGANCAAAGTSTAPITVRAANALKAQIRSSAVEAFVVTGPNWHFNGLQITGVCSSDSNCEHAFHVSGPANGFQLLNSRLVDFNAHVKTNADPSHRIPNGGLIQGNQIYDTRPRNTSNPVTPLDLDNISNWVVRANVIRDFQKLQGDGISYGVFAKGGAVAPIFERNMVLCTRYVTSGGTRIGMSFGGGGMDPALCAPNWGGTTCNPEVSGGIMRNNIVINCSDVGIYLNNAKNSHILYNTLVATAGIDFRFTGSTGEARGNVLSGSIRMRDGGTFSGSQNITGVALTRFQGWYQAPLQGDLDKKGELSALIGKGTPISLVTNDYCARSRVGKPAYDLGALQASLGDCNMPRQ